IRSYASCRDSSQSSVNRLMFPPARVCSAPPSVPTKLRDRTVIPRISRRERTCCTFVLSRFHPERLRERPIDASATGGAPLRCHFRPWTPGKDERGHDSL